MKNKIICIPIETKVREFDGKILLAAHLLNSNQQVMIGSRKGINREMNYLQNSIYFAKSISRSLTQFYENLCVNGNKIVVQNVEGGILYEDEKEHFISSYPKELLPLLDSIYLFGSKIKKIFIESIPGVDETKLHITGDFRFDLLKSKYREFYQNEVDEIYRKYGKFILFNTSFSLANPFVGEKKLKQFIDENSDFDSETRDKLFFKNKFYTEILNHYLDVIEELANKFHDVNFIIRPHPSESLKVYQNKFDSFENVIVTNEGNVHNWILASTGVVHYDCTTGIESVLAEKPTIAFVPQKNKEVFAWLPAFVSKEVDNTKDIIRQIENILMGKHDCKLSIIQHDTLEKYIANIATSCVEAIVKSIHGLTKNALPTVQKKSFKLEWLRIRSIMVFLKNKFLQKDKKSIVMKKFGRIDKTEIINKIKSIQKIENFSFRFKVKKLGSDVILISKK